MKIIAPRIALIASTAALTAALTVPVAGVVHAESADRQAFYGDLHLHTSYSFDAYVLFGAKVDPDAAYRFARGESVEFLGEKARRNEPLDFLAVTDHSENIGVFNSLDDPDSEFSKTEAGKAFKANPAKAFFDAILSGKFASGKLLEGVSNAKALSQSAWQREIEAANRNYRPGTFTTFIAYEWSSMPDGQNLHRNVIFRGDKAPNPFSSVDSPKPEDLWSWLDKIRAEGFEALAIPHNSNASKSLDFAQEEQTRGQLRARCAGPGPRDCAAHRRGEPLQVRRRRGQRLPQWSQHLERGSLRRHLWWHRSHAAAAEQRGLLQETRRSEQDRVGQCI
jgi:hypothetical protein